MKEDQRAKGSKARQWRLLFVDDHPVVRAGLVQVINQESDLVVCGEVSTSADALNMLSTEKPDLILVDVNLGGENGLDLVEKIRASLHSPGVLVLSIYSEKVFAERALRAGASGYVMKEEANTKVIGAIRKVLAGGTFVSDAVAARIRNGIANQHKNIAQFPMDRLSDRELDVFDLVGQGFGPKEIAEKLFISPRTVESHREKIKTKLGLSSASKLLRYAIQYRMIH